MSKNKELPEKVTLIVFSDDLDKAIAGFNIAITAASLGLEVTMFFTFWGMNIIRKENKSTTKNIKKKLFNLINRGGAKRLKLSKFNMLGLGTYMMKKVMEEGKMPSVEEMIGLAKEQNVKLIACSPTMEIMGVKKEDLIKEVDEVGGVATYLNAATDSRVNLFV